jgi:hypothetical protein
MTEAEWLACADPTPMLEFLRGRVSDRKLRLFAVACCRRLGNRLSDRYSRKALRMAERYADAELSEDKLGFVWGDARRAARVAYRRQRETAEAAAMMAVSMLCETDTGRAVTAVGWAAACEAYSGPQPRLADVQRGQIFLLREIFGNPFRPVAADPNWLAWNGGTVPKLAQSIYDERRFADLLVLADALEEAGCTNADLLDHCRRPGEHVRGCWAVDLLMGKG